MKLVKHRREGMALVMVFVVLLAVATLVGTASVVGSSSMVMATQEDRMSTIVAAADAGLEEGRAMLNGNKTLYPDSGYTTLENGVAVTDAAGNTIRGIRRWTYAGPIGITTGQYGVFGSIVTVVQDQNGDKFVRREEVFQESFAKFAYFTDYDFSLSIWFGGGDQLFGPVHSNDQIGIHYTGATFHSTVTTAKTIYQKNYGTYYDKVTEHGLNIPMPTTTDLAKLRNYAIAGGSRIVSNTNGGADQAETRIEFVAVDLDSDGFTNGPDEGFFRVYQSANETWVSADVPGGGLTSSMNCGDVHSSHGNAFLAAPSHTYSSHTSSLGSLQSSSRVCYLGGDPALFGGTFQATDAVGPGQWLPWTGTVDPRLSSRPDKNYLWPLSRAINPNFKGVIFIDGKAIISGTVRGRITIAATDNIIIGDDLRYVTNPSAGTCSDIVGIFSGTDVVVADNALNSAVQPSGSGTYYTYDDTRDEFIDGIVLALDNFTAFNYNSGSTSAQPCGSTTWGRGCLFLTGGVIQRSRGPVGTTSGTGYLKRYDYDRCAYTDPPPYFPTTGHFARGRYFEVDPRNFNIGTYFSLLSGVTP